MKITNLSKKKLSFHKHNAFEEIDPQIPTLGMLTYSDFYCISEHLGAWDRGNMSILRIGTKMTSGEPPIVKLDPENEVLRDPRNP